MATELFTEKRTKIRNWMWRQRLERSSSSHAGLIGDTQNLTLLLGLRGSGVDHLGSMISQPGMPVRYYQDHVARFEPRIQTTNGPDRLAMPYNKDLPKDHPILRSLRMTMELSAGNLVTPTNRVGGEHPDGLLCLVKESRGLLAAEAILRQLDCRLLLYVSDPVKILDRMFDEEGLETTYLVEEGRSVLAPYFLSRFLRRDYGRVLHVHQRIRRTRDVRKRTILHRVLVVALIQHMFRMLAARYPDRVSLAEYDQLAFNPVALEGIVKKAFDKRGEDLGRRVVMESSFRPDGKDYLVWKNVWPEKTIVSGFFTPEEVRLCYQVLRDSGLATRIAEQSRYQPVDDKEKLKLARTA
jgi:hypothetical protein